MNPFDRLGLPPTHDEREIKRAYARELKRCRPDEDPQGFQALHEAYSHCLALAQRADAGPPQRAFIASVPQAREPSAEPAPPRAEPSPDRDAAPVPEPVPVPNPVPPPGPTPTPSDDSGDAPSDEPIAAAEEPAPAHPRATRVFDPTSRPSPARTGTRRPGRAPQAEPAEPAEPAQFQFDLEGFLGALLARAGNDRPIEIERWLSQLEALYSIELKHALRHPVAHAMATVEPPLPPDAVRTIAEFFVLVSMDPREERLRHALSYALQRSEQAAQFERIVAQRCSPRTRPVDRWLMHELLGPAYWLRRWFIALVPTLPARLMELLRRLEQTDAERVETRLDPTALAFWRGLADRTRVGASRTVVSLLRLLLFYMLIVGAASLLMGLDPAPLRSAGINLSILAGAWLIWALATAALLRIKPWLARRWGWDLPIFLAVIGLSVCLAAGYFYPVEAACLALFIGVGLILLRGPVHSVPATVFYIATTALVLVASMGVPQVDGAIGLLALSAAGFAQIAHDVTYARRQRISLAQVRASSGWLWKLTLLASVVALGLLAIGMTAKP